MLNGPPRYPPATPIHTPYVPRFSQAAAAIPTIPIQAPSTTARTPQRDAPPHMQQWTVRTAVPGTPFTPTPQGRYAPSTPANPFYTPSNWTLNSISIFAKGTPATPTRIGPSHSELATMAIAQSITYLDTEEGATA